MSFPPGTEMFQFPGFAPGRYGFTAGYPPRGGWVAPFGDPRIEARSRLPEAYRSVPRPSSPLDAKASTRCPSLALPAPAAAPPGWAARPPRARVEASSNEACSSMQHDGRRRSRGATLLFARRHHTIR
jgi:hypothetical protein